MTAVEAAKKGWLILSQLSVGVFQLAKGSGRVQISLVGCGFVIFLASSLVTSMAHVGKATPTQARFVVVSTRGVDWNCVFYSLHTVVQNLILTEDVLSSNLANHARSPGTKGD